MGLYWINEFTYQFLCEFLYKEWAHPFLYLGSDKNKWNKSWRTDRYMENIEEIRKAIPPYPRSTLELFTSTLFYRKHYLPRRLKTTAGLMSNGKEMAGRSLGEDVRVWGKDLPWLAAKGTWTKMQSNQKMAQTQVHPSRSMWGNVTQLSSNLPSACLNEWIQQAIFGCLLCKHSVGIISDTSAVWP